MEYAVDYLSEQNASCVAQLYADSYRRLSAQYKKPEEMACYTSDYFDRKVKNFLKEQESHIFVLSLGGHPIGFARFSPVPGAYRQPGIPLVTQPEAGVLDGVPYQYDREIAFSNPTKITRETVMLNQIYFDPAFQRQGLGSVLLATALPRLNERYTDMLVEYNMDNAYARRFYTGLGFKQIATTFDLDHIIARKRYYSPVGIGHTNIRACLERLLTNGRLCRHKITLSPYITKGRQYVD